MRNGRPRGSAYDDLTRVAAIRRHMTETGSSRRVAIIALFGHGQLRRLEKKVAGTSSPNLRGELARRLTLATALEERAGLALALIDEGAFASSRWERPYRPEALPSNRLNPFALDPG